MNSPMTAEQLAKRRLSIGCSDLGVMLGLSNYKDPLALYLEKVGELEPEPDKPVTRAGRVMEAAIAELASFQLDRKLRRSNITHTHESLPLTGHIDRDQVGVPRGLEIKNVGRGASKDWGKAGDPDGVPAYYIPQVQGYLMLFPSYEAWDVAAYFGGADLSIYPIERDQEWEEIITEGVTKFWEHVETRTPPPFDPEHPAALKTLQRMYPGTTGETIQAPDDLLHWREVMQQAKSDISDLTKVVDACEARLRKVAGSASILTFSDGQRWERKLVKRAAYEVKAVEYYTARIVKPKSTKESEA